MARRGKTDGGMVLTMSLLTGITLLIGIWIGRELWPLPTKAASAATPGKEQATQRIPPRLTYGIYSADMALGNPKVHIIECYCSRREMPRPRANNQTNEIRCLTMTQLTLLTRTVNWEFCLECGEIIGRNGWEDIFQNDIKESDKEFADLIPNLH